MWVEDTQERGDNMLLNPTKINKPNEVPRGSVQAQDPFDAPIPGQSLTEEPGKYPFEQPPEMVDVDEAVEYAISKIVDDPEATEQVEKLMMMGMPIESIVNTIAFTGFAEGKWNPDIAELMKPPLSAFFIILAKESNIPAIMYNTDDEQSLPDEQVIRGMKEGNPEAFGELQRHMQVEQNTPDGFLDMPPEEQPMIETQPMIEEQPIDEEGGMI